MKPIGFLILSSTLLLASALQSCDKDENLTEKKIVIDKIEREVTNAGSANTFRNLYTFKYDQQYRPVQLIAQSLDNDLNSVNFEIQYVGDKDLVSQIDRVVTENGAQTISEVVKYKYSNSDQLEKADFYTVSGSIETHYLTALYTYNPCCINQVSKIEYRSSDVPIFDYTFEYNDQSTNPIRETFYNISANNSATFEYQYFDEIPNALETYYRFIAIQLSNFHLSTRQISSYTSTFSIGTQFTYQFTLQESTTFFEPDGKGKVEGIEINGSDGSKILFKITYIKI